MRSERGSGDGSSEVLKEGRENARHSREQEKNPCF